MNIIEEPTPLNGASDKRFLEHTLLNLLAANQFGKLMTDYIDRTNEKFVQSKLLSKIINESQQHELY